MADPEVDEPTGMPIVPEGYFWRVRTYKGEYDYNPVVVVELRRHDPRWYSKTRSIVLAKEKRSTSDKEHSFKGWRGYEVPFAMEVTDVQSGVLNAAFDVYAKYEDFLLAEKRSQALEIALDAVVGDYPPKKLEVK